MSVNYIVFFIVIFCCGLELYGQPAVDGKKGQDDIQVAVYYLPNWRPVPISLTSYTWLHHQPLSSKPSSDYVAWGNRYMKTLFNGGGDNGLEKPASALPLPYHINVTMGWDSSPRCRNDPDWINKKGYPYGPVAVNNTPGNFERFLRQAKKLTQNRPPEHRVITVTSWNEWGEGSYLESDSINGMGYLEAIKNVFN